MEGYMALMVHGVAKQSSLCCLGCLLLGRLLSQLLRDLQHSTLCHGCSAAVMQLPCNWSAACVCQEPLCALSAKAGLCNQGAACTREQQACEVQCIAWQFHT